MTLTVTKLLFRLHIEYCGPKVQRTKKTDKTTSKSERSSPSFLTTVQNKMETAPLTNLKPGHNDIIRTHFPPELFGGKK